MQRLHAALPAVFRHQAYFLWWRFLTVQAVETVLLFTPAASVARIENVWRPTESRWRRAGLVQGLNAAPSSEQLNPEAVLLWKKMVTWRRTTVLRGPQTILTLGGVTEVVLIVQAKVADCPWFPAASVAETWKV